MEPQAATHADLMDRTYRHQRLIYDATRRHFLLGRDRLIAALDPAPGAAVLEIACGTGRNLALIARRYPGRRLYGLDISEQMLRSARARLAGRAMLCQADACDFDGAALFGEARFERIVLSYSVSMIPDWRAALVTAAQHLTDRGQLHVVDFGDQAGLPRWFRSGLRAWLARFHVQPRADLAVVLGRIAADLGGTARVQSLYRDYAVCGVLERDGGRGPGPGDAG